MEENNQKKFTVTDEIIASHSQRFLNLLMELEKVRGLNDILVLKIY